MSTGLEAVAQAMVAGAKGLLAADETPRTLTRRLEALNIASTPESRRAYREMLFTTPGIAQFISAVILQDETIRQQSADGVPLVNGLAEQGIIPGIKVDLGARPLAGSPDELVTEGLDGLRDRLAAYRQMGAHFAKWRAVLVIEDGLPTAASVHANAHALGRYAALCQEQELVPIVEPEVLMDGPHPIERCQEVTELVLQAVFDELAEQHVALEQLVLKPNMVLAGQDASRQASVEEVALATLRTLRRRVPPAVPGIVFLSGGQGAVLATQHLDAIKRLAGPSPWKLSFAFARALQDEALAAWGGLQDDVPAGQGAFLHRARCASAAVQGRYEAAMERETALA
jgi:fructose-bisphosphate aldolase class I